MHIIKAPVFGLLEHFVRVADVAEALLRFLFFSRSEACGESVRVCQERLFLVRLANLVGSSVPRDLKHIVE